MLALAFLAAIKMRGPNLSSFEAFDFWTLGVAALIPACIAIAGLATSIVVPMAYCHYGCPTGALLGFVRSASTQEHFQKRDGVALLLLLTAFFLTPHKTSPLPAETNTTLRGAAFGTTWSIKLRDPLSPKQQTQLHSALSEEIARIESTLSHWSKNSATSRFNASTSTEEQEIPEELGALVDFALRINKASSGAYDITVAPLVAAWGYGPPGTPENAPSKMEIDAMLETVGSDKLFLSPDRKHLRKSHPSMTLDLGSILQGYAVDQLYSLLKKTGCQNFLIDVGGELRAEQAWQIAIENPADAQKPLEIITLKNASLATSGLARARRKLSGQTVSHIISPKTGYPVTPTIEACSVQCETCLEADGWSTAVIASGLPKAETLSKSEHLSVWILEPKGTFRRLD
jgi:thiamine biosynthesis lipoprotein